MTLVGMMMAGPGEADRYLPVTVPALLEFCDTLVVRVEAQPERDYLLGLPPERLRLMEGREPFYAHEGRARQELLDYTYAVADPLDDPWILAVDADELVDDGAAARRAIERGDVNVFALCLQEVWNADAFALELRQDGGWDEYDARVLWRVAAFPDAQIRDRKLASGRTPHRVFTAARNEIGFVCTALLHFGWTNPAERAARHARYEEHDRGEFHQRSHLASILAPDQLTRLRRRGWPETWPDDRKQALLKRVAWAPAA